MDKSININPLQNFSFGIKNFLQLILLCLPVILLGNNLLFAIPLLIAIVLTLIFGERFLMLVIIVSLFTLVGEVSRTLRSVVYLFDFSLLGYFFLRKYGLDFNYYPKIPRSVLYLLILYFSAMIISTVMSRFPSAGIGIILQQMSFFVIVYVFFALIEDQSSVKTYFTGVYSVAIIIVALSIVIFIRDGLNLVDIISQDRVRIAVITGNYETSTNFLVVSFPLIIGMLLKNSNDKNKILLIFLLIFFMLGLFLVMSRSAIIGIVFSTAIIFFLLNRRLFYRLLFFVLSAVMIFIIYQPLNELLTVFLRIDSGMSARDYLWQLSVDMIKDNPIFGIGPGTYNYEMMNYFPYMLDDWWGRFIIYTSGVSGGANLSHNFFLSLFTELGILGILTAIALPVVYLRIGIKTILKYRMEDKNSYYLIVSLFAAGSSIILRNFFNGIGLIYVGGLQTDLPFWLIFSSLIYFYKYEVGDLST